MLQNKMPSIYIQCMATRDEFKAVFITDVCEGIIPYNKALLDSQIEEERRLMYVAMTRAKEKLYLVYPKKRYGQDTAMSRFISEASV